MDKASRTVRPMAQKHSTLVSPLLIALLGPLALADLIGLDVCLAILEVLHRDLGDDKYRAAPLLRTMVAAGRLGRKSGRGFYVYRD